MGEPFGVDPDVMNFIHERFIEKIFGKSAVRSTVYTVERMIEIDAGHRVPYHDSQCRFLHGHRWKIIAVIAGKFLHEAEPFNSESGMVIDFGNIKRALMEEIHAKFDHKLILWDRDPLLDLAPIVSRRDGRTEQISIFDVLDVVGIAGGLVQVPVIPTSEGLAQYWASLLAPRLKGPHFWLHRLEVWETPNSVATFHCVPAE